MQIHVLCIGDELLSGNTLNTNLAFLGRSLADAGYRVRREICIPDTPEAIEAAVVAELAEADIVITIGGLGPTSDDVTRPVVARALGLSLRLDRGVLREIQAYLSRRNVRVPSHAIETQAMVPEGALVLPNRTGTAPGLWCVADTGKAVVMLPGPPRELRPMFLESVLPRLRRLAPPDRIFRILKVCGVPESTVAARVEALLPAFPGVSPAYCAKPAEVALRLCAPPDRGAVLAAAADRVREELADAVLPEDAPNLPAAVGKALRERAWALATAESCTAGGIAAAITDVPGASSYFAGGVVAYSNAVKLNVLGVSGATLHQFGAVSAETVAEMVRGVRRLLEVETAVAVTGIAGPDGGTPEKPVGLVYIATAVRDHVRVRRFLFPGSRENIRLRTVTVALNDLRLHILGTVGDGPSGAPGSARP
ncbi:MAG: CinA family nicotinamide mononucleotide deamidase-related protein [Kiritimatiellaeota bacterium]|nr:CinA family nicotinamide mononucleotide deamidase-related protein [Kiritimatiellota bacterium]